MVPLCVTPQDHESTSISSLCFESSDSPLMSPIFAKMSVAITMLLSYGAWTNVSTFKFKNEGVVDPEQINQPSQTAAWKPAGAIRSTPPADSADGGRTSPSSNPGCLRLPRPSLRRRPAVSEP